MSTINWNDYRQYTIDKINNAVVDYEPYWHVKLDDTLHPELFNLCKQEWPDYSCVPYTTNHKGFNQNRKFTSPNTKYLPFYSDFYKNIIDHPDIKNAVYSLEGLDINNFSHTLSSLWEDYKGYGVHNHVDAYKIDVAWQLYVYCDGGEKWGTSLNDEYGNELKKFPFIPNLSWIVRNDAFSWHSCDEIECDLRQSIMARFMSE